MDPVARSHVREGATTVFAHCNIGMQAVDAVFILRVNAEVAVVEWAGIHVDGVVHSPPRSPSVV